MNITNYNTAVIILAAGSGNRFNKYRLKQDYKIFGKSILYWTVMRFISIKELKQICVVVKKEKTKKYKDLSDLDNRLLVTAGGNTRQESVKLGLQSLKPYNQKKILIHDGARPLVSKNLIKAVIRNLTKHPAVVPVIPLNDSLKIIRNNFIEQNVDRDNKYLAQTPQGFHYNEIINLYKDLKDKNISDDAEIYELNKKKVYTIKGDMKNIKLTRMEDISIIKKILKSNLNVKVGTGFDVHKFTNGNSLKLLGVSIPFNKSLLGHSDADVAMHALIDAILGSLSMGDIGQHFPPSSKKWKNYDSSKLLEKVVALVNKKNALISHVDITIICEKPLIKKHTTKMREHISLLINTKIENISVKATTTEGLGFLGRKEGIASQATVTSLVYDNKYD